MHADEDERRDPAVAVPRNPTRQTPLGTAGVRAHRVDHGPSDEDWAAANAIVPEQPWRLAAVLTGDAAPAGWWGAGRPATWSDAIVALVVAESVPAAEVEAALAEGAGPLLESLRLFDVYASEQVGAGLKSLAYKLAFRAPDRTLTVEEAVAARDAAVSLASARVGAQLRGA